MKVREFIEFLQTMPQDIDVAYTLYSEQCLLKAKDISVKSLCLPRPDGWIQHARKDMATQDYLLLPGN